MEVVGSLKFNAPVDDPNSILETRSTSQDGNLRIELDNPNAGQEMVNIGQERRDDGIGGSDGIQMASWYVESNLKKEIV